MKNYKKFLSEEYTKKKQNLDEWFAAAKLPAANKLMESQYPDSRNPLGDPRGPNRGDSFEDSDRIWLARQYLAMHRFGENKYGEDALRKSADTLKSYGLNPRHEFVAHRIHDAWMQRNPMQDWNRHLHKPYENLSSEEQGKDLAHVLAIERIAGNPLRMLGSENHEDLANALGAELHDAWRQGHAARGGGPRIKPVSSGESVDINVPWEELHPEWKHENHQAGLAAARAYQEALRLGL